MSSSSSSNEPTQNDGKYHTPWAHTAKPRKKHSRSSSLITGRDGKQYYVSINGNGMVGVQRVVNGKVKRGDFERMRYADEILRWMEDSARAANDIVYAPPQTKMTHDSHHAEAEGGGVHQPPATT